MFDRNIWQEVLESLSRHWLRTLLTGLSVFWGMFILVLLLGSAMGLQRGVEYQFRDDAINSLWIYPGTTSVPWQGLPAGREVRFTNTDFDRFRRIDRVEHITGRYYLWGEFSVSRGDLSSAFNIRCVHPGHRYLENTIVTAGRFLNEADLRSLRKVCVIGRDVYTGLFPDGESALGEYIKIKGTLYRVVGVFDDKGGRNENRQIYLPVTTAQRVDNGRDRLHQIMFTFGDADFAESRAIEAETLRDLSTRHRFDPADEQAVHISNDLEGYKRMRGLFTGIRSFVWIIGILTLVAGIIGISNIMLISVTERTKEIGVRKAMGATNGGLVWMVMIESVLITLLAGYAGVVPGIGILWAADSFLLPSEPGPETMFMNPGVTPGVILGALALLVLVGALSGLIPAVKAVRIPPAAAMKYD